MKIETLQKWISVPFLIVSLGYLVLMILSNFSFFWWLDSYLIPLKSYAAIAFYYATGSVAVLSYLRAKDSILAPLRTELFKMQLKELERIIEFFNTNSKDKFRSVFHFYEIYEINFLNMLSEYAKRTPIVLEDMEQALQKVIAESYPLTLVKTDNIRKIRTPDVEILEERNNSILNKAKKTHDNDEYSYGRIHLPSSVSTLNDQLIHWSSNPIIAQKLRDEIEEFYRLVTDSYLKIESSLTKASRDLGNSDVLIRVVTDRLKAIRGYYNEYNAELDSLDQQAFRIMGLIKQHYQFDSIWNN